MSHTPAPTASEQELVDIVSPTFDVVGFIMAFECEDMDEDDIVDGFQHLIDSGIVWSLQGSYGRMAQALIDNGWCSR